MNRIVWAVFFIMVASTLTAGTGVDKMSGLFGDGVIHQSRLQGDTLNAPDLRCLKIRDTNDVKLSWKPVNDPSSSFHCYVIYRGQNLTNPFSVIDTVWTRTKSTYEDFSPGGVPGRYYYMSTVSKLSANNFYEKHGDTLQSIALTVVNPINSGLAQLSWNSLFPYKTPSPKPYYLIDKKIDTGSWFVLDSTQNLSYQDTISVCSADIQYRIRLRDSSNCYSRSNADGGNYKDKIPPNTPAMDSVSVDSGDTHIAWEESSAGDLWGYIIYKQVNNLWTPLDTLFGKHNIHYLDTLSDGCDNVNLYNVSAFDSCWNTSSSGKKQWNMVLRKDYDICNSKVELSWNGYINMVPGLKGYRVYKSTNGGSFQFLGINNPGDTTYVDSNLVDGNEYCYYVKAVNTNGKKTSSSCQQCVYHKGPDAPDYIYLSTATVSHNDQAVVIRGITDSTEFVKQVNIYRSRNKTSGYSRLTTIPAANAASLFYTDLTAKYNQRKYYYKAFAVDSCGNESTESNIVNTIYLQKGQINFMENRIKWNNFEGWPGSSPVYSIFRRVRPQTQYQEIVTGKPYSSGTFKEDVSALYDTEGEFYYYVIAHESSGNPYGISDSSVSNIVVCDQSSKIYIPNAFNPNPGGYNKIFKPFNVYMDYENYRFTIYNRWGEKIFTTDKPNEGWDGTYKGSKAEAGVYIYQLKYTTNNGETRKRKGTVTLLR